MKLIKAYIRTNMIDKVVHALEEAGFSDMTIIGSRFHFHQRSEAQTGYLRHGQPRRRQFVRRRFA
jgi:nitrogen regulatory protein PII